MINRSVGEYKNVFSSSPPSLIIMTHYVCTGGCEGVSDKSGTCQASDCSKHEHSLITCNCTDNEHKEAYDVPIETEEK